MKFKVIAPFTVKTRRAGMVSLRIGQEIELSKEKATHYLVENKIAEIKQTSSEYAGGSNEKNVIEVILDMFDGKIVGFTGTLKETYEERAAIMEFDGGLTREEAEDTAKKIVIKQIVV